MAKNQLDSSGVGCYEYYIQSTDADYKDQIQLHALGSMLQEAASLHAEDLGIGATKMAEINGGWILVRLSIRMIRRPFWKEKIYIHTWSCGYDKMSFYRNYQVFDEKKQKIGEGTSVWIMVNLATRRPIRPDVLGDLIKHNYELQPSMDMECPKLKSPFSLDWMAENLKNKDTLIKHADFTSIDRNKHVNNTHYIAWSVDAAHKKGLTDIKITGIDINFQTEVLFGEKITLFKQENFLDSAQESVSNWSIAGYNDASKKVVFTAHLFG